MAKSTLVAGGTELVGPHCLGFLLASPEYASVTALVPDPWGLRTRSCASRFIDFDNLSDLLPADEVFCALGTTIKKAASQAGFRRVDFRRDVVGSAGLEPATSCL
jgi:uncharacterized protein YbjT (DUF2867 family)